MFNRILFSAVGGTDPIANYKDGPILHICRVYRPSVVVLYLSAEMCIAQENDKRFTYVLEQLCEHLHFKMDIRLMQDTELHDVHHFDVIIPNFAKQLESLLEEFPDAEVMLNLSSGTPAMKSAFHTLSAFYPDRTKGIQVWTPKKRMNQVEEDRINYDVESYWELNEDNAEDFQNRCVEAETIQLLAKHKRGIVKQLIRMMDYRGAWQVAMDIQDEISEIARYGILWAAERYDLNYHKMMDLQKQYGEFYRLPDKHDDRRNTVEYILSTKARAERQAYVDFLRALTPLILWNASAPQAIPWLWYWMPLRRTG
jgi:CRISPR type III-A/MTUBE-associated protein Csm6